ncbi:MAG: adenylyltransferase/cytidyltransferase family protein [Minisyncoccales bacterium]
MKEKSVNQAKNKKKKIRVAVSGGFDPLHIGHIRLFKEAKKLGDELIVILNNDNWLKKKKSFVFIPEKERKELLEAIKWVDKVVLTSHRRQTKDISVNKELKRLKPDIFANGGDRTKDNIPEVAVCKRLGCKIIFNVGGAKIQSSSWLLKKFLTYAQKQK